MHPTNRATGSRLASVQPSRRADSRRRLTAVSLISDGAQAVFPVGPSPFVYVDGMRLRIEIISGRAFVLELP
jgi:hypothetical protein